MRRNKRCAAKKLCPTQADLDITLLYPSKAVVNRVCSPGHRVDIIIAQVLRPWIVFRGRFQTDCPGRWWRLLCWGNLP